jgi:hypothetical protein
MQQDPVLPSTTLAIVLGASQWPYAPELPAQELFANSARDFVQYLLGRETFGLPEENLLNLFDSPLSPNELDHAISMFLIDRQERRSTQDPMPTDLILFYVGHAGFTPGDSRYFLAMRCTRSQKEGASSLRISDLANTLRNDARVLRRYLILDCCFAGSAYAEFMSIAGPAEAARVQTLDEMPASGTALLCASSSRDVAIAPQGALRTMFSAAMLEVLNSGNRNLGNSLSLSELGDLVRRMIHARHASQAVRPQVESPDQRRGNIANIPLFPNLALRQEPAPALRAHVKISVPTEGKRRFLGRWYVWLFSIVLIAGIAAAVLWWRRERTSQQPLIMQPITLDIDTLEDLPYSDNALDEVQLLALLAAGWPPDKLATLAEGYGTTFWPGRPSYLQHLRNAGADETFIKRLSVLKASYHPRALAREELLFDLEKGAALAKEGRMSDAMQAFEDARKLDPKNPALALPGHRFTPSPVVGTTDRSVTLSVDPHGIVCINEEVIKADELGNRLTDIFKTRAERVLFISIDPTRPFGEVAKLISVAQDIDVLDRIVPRWPVGHQPAKKAKRSVGSH